MIFLLALILPLSTTKKRTSFSFFLSFAFTVIALVSLSIFQTSYPNTIYMDAILAVFFGYTIYVIFSAPAKKNFFDYAQICIVLAFLPLIKQTGILFALLGMAILAIDMFFRTKKNLTLQDSQIGSLRRKIGHLVLFILPILIWQCWNLYVQHLGIVGQFAANQNVSLVDAISALGTESGFAYDVAVKYVHAWIFDPMNTGRFLLSAPIWLTILTVLILFPIRFANLEAAEKWRLKCIAILLAAGFLAYSLFLLLMYINGGFSPDESLRLASMQRYLSTWLTGMLLLALAAWRQGFENAKTRVFSITTFAVLIAGIVVFTPPWFHFDLFAEHYYEDAQIARAEQLTYIEQIKSENNLDPALDRVWIANETQDGSETFFYLAYRMLPLASNTFFDTNVVGASIDNSSMTYSLKTTPQDWSQILRDGGYTVLYLENLSDNFVKDFGEMFYDPAHINDHALYRIEYDGDNAIFINV
jgi:hypothetical protein